MPKVYNKRHNNAPPGAVYIGRPSKWGNPFTHDRRVYEKHKNGRNQLTLVESREIAVQRYRAMMEIHKPDLSELRGKDLICWCAPLPCHGDVLLELANEG